MRFRHLTRICNLRGSTALRSASARKFGNYVERLQTLLSFDPQPKTTGR